MRQDLKVVVARTRETLGECLCRGSCMDDGPDAVFAALPPTRRPGQAEWTSSDSRDRLWRRVDERHDEEAHEALVPEIGHSEFVPKFPDACFERVHSDLCGRVRIVAALAVERVET